MDPCNFPSLNQGQCPDAVTAYRPVDPIAIDHAATFCASRGIPLEKVILATWSIVLQRFADVEVAIFGQISEGSLKKPLIINVDANVPIQQFLYNISAEQEPKAVAPSFNTAVSFSANANYPLDLEHLDCDIVLHGTNTSLGIHYSTSLLSPKQAQNLCGTIVQTSKSLIDNWNGRIRDVESFSPENRDDVAQWNRRAYPTPTDSLLPDIISEEVKAHPDAQAVGAWDGDFTYAELEDVSSSLSLHLQDRGIGPGVLVPICFVKSRWSIVAMLAILKAGAAVVPLDPAQPVDRLRKIVHQVNGRIILAAEQTAELLADSAEVIVVNKESTTGRLTSQSASHQRPSTLFEHTGVVMFTSGSTGEPKGCVFDHQALSSIVYYGKILGITQGTRVFQFASCSFMISICDVFCTLTNGGTICIPSEHERLNDLANAINRTKADFIHTTPSVISSLDPLKVPGLKSIACGGEPMTKSLIQGWAHRVKLGKILGQTEWICMVCSQPDVVNTSSTNVGNAAFAKTWLVMPNDPLKLAPVGAVAELCLEGPGLTRGFLNDPVRSSAAFVDNPPWLRDFRPDGQGRIYRSGDLVRYDSDGSLNFLGRKGMMVKILGQRVELGEVEYRLKKSFHDAKTVVADTVAPSGGDGTRILVAFVGPSAHSTRSDGSTAPSTDPLFATADETFRSQISIAHESICAALPRWMAPTIYIPLKSVPVTISGKINRRVLREHGGTFTRQELEALCSEKVQKVPPTTARECELHSTAAQILKLEANTFGVRDSFFALGGDSLKAMQLISSLLEKDILLSVQDIFNERSISKLALVARNAEKPTAADQDIYRPYDLLPTSSQKSASILHKKLQADGLSVDTIEDAYPCSPMQQGILLSQLRDPTQYQIYVSWEVVSRDGNPVKVDRLIHAWQTLVHYHPALRTVISNGALEEQASIQVLLKSGLTPHPMSCDSDNDVQNTFESNRDTHIAGKSLLPRFSLCQTPTNRVFCALEINHTLFDATSSAILTRDLARAYDGALPGADGPRYRDYISYLQSISGETSLNYWKQHLDGCSPCYFPTLNESPSAVDDKQSLLVKIDLPPSHAIRTFCQAHSLTLSNLFQVAWGLVLKAFTGSETVCFGYMTSGRDAPVPRIQETIGVFINMLLCRIDLLESVPIVEILRKAQRDFIECLPHQHLPLAEILHGMDMSGTAMFNTAMSLTMEESDSSTQSSISFAQLSHQDDTEYDIWLEATTVENGIDAALIYRTSALSEGQAKGIASSFSQAISEIIAKPSQFPEQMDLISSHDQQRLVQWSSQMPEAETECVHDLIRQRCIEQPGAPAVCAWDGDFTYTELDRLSTQFANHLANHGVVPDMLVPLCFEKSRWTTVAILGVLKAGGAFVLLDPSHPVKRLQEMCRAFNASIAVVSTEIASRGLELAPKIITLGTENQTWQLSDDCQLSVASSRNLAYAVFTSGSTGKPKGVLIEHSTFATMAREYLRVTESDQSLRFLQFASYAFDVSVSDHLATLLAGGCICIPSETERNSDLPGAINRMKVTCADLTPSFLRSMQPKDIPSVKTLILGGEPMSRADIAKWSQKVRMVNVYGPAECGVGSTVQPRVTLESNPYNIGFPTGGVCWVVDKTDHDKLMPVGAIGELLIEGPIVGRGYLNDPEKTCQVFIDTPNWLPRYRPGGGRMYKTGDLAHFAEDGSLRYMGRKDMQVKLRGQRIELGEVEYHVGDIFEGAQEVVADVINIKSRPLLVAFVFCAGVATTDDFFAPPSTEFRSRAASAESKLQETVPVFMVPNVFVPLSYVPLTKTAKTDRRRLRERAAEGLDAYLAPQGSKRPPSTEIETILHGVWTRVLNTTPENVGVDDSFFRLGGDSITAMQVSSQARASGVSLSVSDIFRHKAIAAIAPHVKKREVFGSKIEEKFDTWFDLSPIQEMFFEENPHFQNHFNQAFLFQVVPRVESTTIAQAVARLASQHSMLRAYFGIRENGRWSQGIRSNVEGSYRYQEHALQDLDEVKQVRTTTNTSLDIKNGPLFAVDVMDVGEAQYISLIVHHLVMDLVSWRIILADLEELLRSSTTSGIPSTPFQAWCQLQADYGRQHLPPHKALPSSIPPPPEQYWGTEIYPNTYSDTKETSFKVDQEITSALFGTANEAFGTQPVEIFQAALLASFVQTFHDRPAPTIFNEGHGREPWNSDIDLSRTVGWFTTMWPTLVELTSKHGITDAVRFTKDARRAVPQNGWAYMVSRYHNPDGRGAFGSYGRPEIVFNFLGLYQQLERSDAILKPTNIESSILDVGESLERSCLFDVAASVVDGCLKFDFQWNKHMKHQEMVEAWICRCEAVLKEAVKELSVTPQKPTLCDYSLPGLTYEQLDKFVADVLPTLPKPNAVEAAYPCSPLQRMMLESQSRDVTYYAPSTIGEAIPTGSDPVNIDKLQQAWQKLVDRHSILRTVFVKGFPGEGDFTQVVLSSAQASIQVLDCSPEISSSQLKDIPSVELQPGTLHHHLTVSRGCDGKVNFKLDISHAITDAVSAAVLLHEWQLAYDDQLPATSPPSFSAFISYIQDSNRSEINHWKEHLSGVPPCFLPSTTSSEIGILQNIPIKLGRAAEISDFCQRAEVTLSALIKSAWAVILRTWAKTHTACFGYIISGRHVPVEGVQDILGPLLNILVCKLDFYDGMSHRELWNGIQIDYEKSLASHLGCIPALQELKLSPPSQHLSNTLVNHRKHEKPEMAAENASVRFEELSARDAMEFDVVLQIDETGNDVSLSMDYWDGRIPVGVMEEIAQAFNSVICRFLDSAEGTSLL